jgi:hypothetical protein
LKLRDLLEDLGIDGKLTGNGFEEVGCEDVD